MNNYLFLFTIGPVQSFISQARKAQDLFAGSTLLSHLIDVAIQNLPQYSELIFPSENIKSKPNRFIAKLAIENEKELTTLGNSLEKIVINTFNSIAKKSLKVIPENFSEQINNHFQIYWVANKLNGDDEYPQLYESLESNLGSIKNIRKFDQFAESGRKCSLCGERNVLIYQRGNKSAHISNNAIPVDNLNNSEGLCAVCYAKRTYTDRKIFPSTAEIALANILKDIDYDDYRKLFDNKFDYQYFYDENITESALKKDGIKFIPKMLTELRKIKQNKKFPKHYGIIMSDGDNMGQWLKGSQKNDDISLKEFHKKFTNILGEFAENTGEIIKLPKGEKIYAGGDDYLGFINMDYFYKYLIELREAFNDIINKNIKAITNNKMLTFSAGIVIAHYKYPFSEVLKWARKMEREAKSIDNKNAFAIAVLKHSGEIVKTVYPWGENDENLLAMKFLSEQLTLNNYSPTFIKQMEKEFSLIPNPNEKMFETELRRLLKNSIKDKSVKADNLFNHIRKLYNINFINFISALNIAEFISREMTEVNNEN